MIQECTSTIRGSRCGNTIRDGEFRFLDSETGTLRCRVCTKVWLENNFRKMKGFIPKTEKDVVQLTYWVTIYAEAAYKGDEEQALRKVIELMKLPSLEQVMSSKN